MPLMPASFDPAREIRDQLTPEIVAAPMAEIARQHGLDPEDLRPFPSGTDVVFGGRGFVIKLSAPPWAAELDSELSLLRAVAGRLPVRTAEPLARGDLEGWPYVVMSRLEGVGIQEVWGDLGAAERLALAEELGAATRALHALPIPPDLRGGWDGFLAERLAGVLRHQGRVGASDAWLERIPPLLAEAPRPDRPLVPLHTELLNEHVLVEARGGRWHIAAFLDFADGRVGHPDYELAAPIEFIFQGAPGCLGAFLDAYGWSAEERREAGPRLAAWGLLHQFGSLPRALTACGLPIPTSWDELFARLYDARR